MCTPSCFIGRISQALVYNAILNASQKELRYMRCWCVRVCVFVSTACKDTFPVTERKSVEVMSSETQPAPLLLYTSTSRFEMLVKAGVQ